jgi:hypothetical protein
MRHKQRNHFHTMKEQDEMAGADKLAKVINEGG